VDLLAELRARWERWRMKVRWKLHLVERDAASTRAVLENRGRLLTYQNRLCGCGQLAAADEKRCPACGTRIPGPIGYAVSRLVGAVVPESAMVATAALLVSVLLLYVVMLARSGTGLAALFAFDGKVLWAFGANYSALWRAEPWRLMTSCFLHINALHIVFNVFALVRLGPLVELPFGSARLTVTYLVTGVAGSLASALWHADAPVLSAGASGALCGLMAAGAVYAYRRGGIARRTTGRYLVEWGVWVVVFGIFAGADNAAHAGGAVAGALFGLVLADRNQKARVPDVLWGALAVAGAVAVLACFALQLWRGSPWPFATP
jgi:membrane associated rhomboid family serine protease